MYGLVQENPLFDTLFREFYKLVFGQHLHLVQEHFSGMSCLVSIHGIFHVQVGENRRSIRLILILVRHTLCLQNVLRVDRCFDLKVQNEWREDL